MVMRHGMGAGQCAAVPAAIRAARIEHRFPNFAGDTVRVWVVPKAEIFYWQQVELVHNFDQVRGSGAAHVILGTIECCNFLLDARPSSPHQIHVSHAVTVAA